MDLLKEVPEGVENGQNALIKVVECTHFYFEQDWKNLSVQAAGQNVFEYFESLDRFGEVLTSFDKFGQFG